MKKLTTYLKYNVWAEWEFDLMGLSPKQIKRLTKLNNFKHEPAKTLGKMIVARYMQHYIKTFDRNKEEG